MTWIAGVYAFERKKSNKNLVCLAQSREGLIKRGSKDGGAAGHGYASAWNKKWSMVAWKWVRLLESRMPCRSFGYSWSRATRQGVRGGGSPKSLFK